MALVCAGGAAQVRFEDILKGPGENWLTYAGSYNGWRYAPGRQITPQNAGSLVPKWVYHVPDARGLQTTPIVYEGVMYVTNANNVYAIDARSGRSDLEVFGYASRAPGEQSRSGDPGRSDLFHFRRQLSDGARPAQRRRDLHRSSATWRKV